MKPRLFWTMLTAFALVIVLSVCGMLGFIGLTVSGQWQTQALRDSLSAYQQSYALSLGDYYMANGDSWAGIERRFDEPPLAGPSALFDLALTDPSGRVIASNDRTFTVGENVTRNQLDRGVPVEVRGKRVGLLVSRLGGRNMPNMPMIPSQRPLGIVPSIVRGFVIAGLVLSGALLLMATVFAQRISRPLRTLTAAASEMATGKLDVRVTPARIREVNELTEAFNRMAESLSSADRQRRQMTADIAHELRTPLTIIKGRLEGIQDGVYTATPEELDRLLGETALLERLIEDLRVLALAEAGQLPLYREQLTPRHLLEAARGAFAGQAASQGVALAVEAGDDLPLLDADPQRMAQVLSNLVANALRYTPAGGAITLSATAEDRGLKMEDSPQSQRRPSSTRDPRSSVIIRVSDTGQGIPAEDLPHIFDRFYRADRSRTRSSGGTGLGLAIAKQIVAAHGGTIAASSTDGQGTTISIALPVGEPNGD